MKLGDIISGGFTPCPLCDMLTFRGQVCKQCIDQVEVMRPDDEDDVFDFDELSE